MKDSIFANLSPQKNLIDHNEKHLKHNQLDMKIELIVKRKKVVFNLSRLYHRGCNVENEIEESRIKQIRKYKDALDKSKSSTSHGTLLNGLYDLNSYIIFCDFNDKEPFGRSGFLAFCGNQGELRRLVNLASEPKPFLFMYDDGDELGLTEAAAGGYKASLKGALSMCGIESFDWDLGVRSFKNGLSDSAKPYRQEELDVFLKRVQTIFFSLAIQLVKHAIEHPVGKPKPPESLVAEVESLPSGKPRFVTLKGAIRVEGEECDKNSPFNVCMNAGYLLFCYYTSFNESVVHKVRHPLSFTTSSQSGKTIKYTTVRAFKGRSNKNVDAIFSDFEPSEQVSESTEVIDEAEYLTADVCKTNGKYFIETLVELSKSYSNNTNERLIYTLDCDGNVKTLNSNKGSAHIAELLNLLSSDRIRVVDRLIGEFRRLMLKCTYEKVRKKTLDDGRRVVSKELVYISSSHTKARIIEYAFSIMSCFSDISLKDSLLPLSFSEKNESGNIYVKFSYLDGSIGQIEIPAKYALFFMEIEKYSEAYISNNRPHYLLPLGGKRKTYQWEGLQPVKANKLLNIGIVNGQYFLDLNARRLRATTASYEYKSEDMGLTAREILQNALETFDTRYSNGHPEENTIITSQALQIFERICRGDSKSSAEKSIKIALNIIVLAHDEYVGLRKPTNINGVYCEGDIDLTEEKNEHSAAVKFAEKNGLLNDGFDISCYQYDLCMFCNNAKLVDDEQSIYKLLSFIDCLEEAVDHHPVHNNKLLKKITRFKFILEQNIPATTIEIAENKLFNEGRYPLLLSVDSVMQFV